MHLNGGKLLKYDLKGKTCRKRGNRVFIFMKKKSPGACLPLPRGYIHVHDHNIQTSSALKPLGQSKPNFMWSIVRKGAMKVYINCQGHMTKMATMAINSKNI